jgi:uncharacterized membrane protein YhiD involved in acid resistance
VTTDFGVMLLRVTIARVADALVGYEGSCRGRPAGFRTHALVCMASSLLMLVTVYAAHWMRAAGDSIRLNPTRMPTPAHYRFEVRCRIGDRSGKEADFVRDFRIAPSGN